MESIMPTDPKQQTIQGLYDQYLTSDINAFTRESILWWKNIILETFGSNEILYATPGQWIRGLRLRYGAGRVTKKLTQMNRGQMFMFRYAPKPFRARNLDHWDTLPLVIVLDLYKDGFLGMNLHYLGIKPRNILLQQLARKISPQIGSKLQGSDLDKKMLQDNYEALDKAKTLFREYAMVKYQGRLFKYAKPCFKRYKYNSINSRMYKIPVVEWEMVSNLPSDRFFIGESRRTVQRRSINNLRHGT